MNWKRVIGITTVTLGTAFVATSIVAKGKKGDSVYENEPEQKNPLEGKKVVFVEDENDKENADGVKGHLEAVGDSDYKPGFYERYVKRAADIVLSFGGLVVLSPVLLGISVAIKIDDPGPVLFTQKRMGQNKEYFKLHKFRSMKMCTPHDKPTHMLENPEQYITRVGKFIRAHSLDELPQIWDIFIGNMSVIGPRPGLWNQDLLTAERDKYGANDVKPGLTGWAQINGRDELEIPEKAKLDGEYCRDMGLGMDVKVFLKSLGVFGGDDSVVEGRCEDNKNIGSLDFEEMPLVSIIIATYHRDETLKNAILSLINQSYRNIEIVVVDDNADDLWNNKVQSIIVELNKKDNIVYVQNNTNKGSAATRNIGIDRAKGVYITFLDDDDEYLPDKVKNQVIQMDKQHAQYSITDLSLYRENGKLDEVRRRNYIKKVDKNSLLKYHLLYHMTGTDTMMFRADYLKSIGGFDAIDVGDEFYLMMKAIKAGGNFLYLPLNDVKAYVHAGMSEGLSSGKTKIDGENVLFRYKQKFFHDIDKASIKHIKMRHCAVLAFAYLRMEEYGQFVFYSMKSFMYSPLSCIDLFLERIIK